jgi:hypothetical protein
VIIKGASDIKGIRSLNTRPGAMTDTRGFLKLYQLAAERDNLQRKALWVRRQQEQTEKRLSEIAYGMHVVDQSIERASPSNAHAQFRSTFIEY